ncbi:Transcription elongation factor, GreA/GreB family [Pricia antarctica]|uniref:Transcription elongation factor, GreA/GreB family n=1 Tax=Pricia antarctica TaxID=641691 RepID=A0A1G7HC17_9FLAO|nr:3-oxoacyl-ACP synthase [Pricia antarctica]SDE98000.1 Transcription elongation factor, GreA/GreB family [Pricia antarctica]
MPSKQILFNYCQTFIEGRISRIQKNIRDIQESLASETKSSAGDKHETARAMLQLERERLGQQLAEAERTKQVLLKVPFEKASQIAGLGSWVKTSKADYFLAISAGQFEDDSSNVFCISADTPIGRLLLGKSAGDTFLFHNTITEILSVH